MGGSSNKKVMANNGIEILSSEDFINTLRSNARFADAYEKVYNANRRFKSNRSSKTSEALNKAIDKFSKDFNVDDYYISKALSDEVEPW